MLADRYGLAVSTASTAARDAYVAGADCVLAGTAGAAQHLQHALELDPRFAVAEAALAREKFLTADVKRARELAGGARELAKSATPREQGHVNAIALAIDGKPADALAASRVHLAAHPRDAMVLAPITGVFGLIGFSGRQEREEELYDLLCGLAPHYGDDWWFQCMFAFAASESGRLDEAWRLIEASMTANARNAHGAHVKVHVLHERGEMAQALAFLERWMPGLDRHALMHCHLSWHLALSALALGKTDRAWEAYRDSVHPGGAWGPPINIASDAPSFLWRSELAGQPRRTDLWRDVHEYGLHAFPKAGLPFADAHLALSAAALADSVALDRLLAEMHERLAAGRYPAGPVVPLLADGFAAFARKDWSATIDRLEQALPQTVRIGGSRAQRDVVRFTLIAAYRRAGRPHAAEALCRRETARQPAVTVAA